MNEEKNSRLPEELTRLIHKDIETNLPRFEASRFEEKLSNRIRNRKRERPRLNRWTFVPASLALVLGILLLNTGKEEISTPASLTDHFRAVLESVSTDQSLTATEPFLPHPVSVQTHSSTTVEELTGLIRSAIRTVEGASDVSVSCCNRREAEHTGHLGEEIRSMNRRNDYSELFSRIMNKLTEG